ncbi:MAG: pyridoxine 5'-phosphate synthase [Pyrinomonadaceae bacterium]
MTAKLNVNIDHVATIREARKTIEPSVIEAARICEKAGADGITVHIRGDRRHIQDADIEQLREIVTSYLNVEMAATDEMIEIAISTKPDAVSLVPESPNEVTTEGGLDVIANFDNVKNAVDKLKAADIFVSIFIDPDLEQISAAKGVGAQQVELCTAEYAEATLDNAGIGCTSPRVSKGDSESQNEMNQVKAAAELDRLNAAAVHAHSLGLKVAAGHGLTYRNVAALARTPEITEFNIGHNIISRAVFVGLDQAVKEMIEAIS